MVNVNPSELVGIKRSWWMNKDICKHLDLKFLEFLDKFQEPLRSKLKGKLYFAGGCIYCLANGKEVRDYDLFMYDRELLDELKESDVFRYISDYALSVGKFQIVHKYCGEPNDCIGEFDFLHNMHYYIPFSNQIKCGYDFFDDANLKYIHTNELIFNESRARDIEGVLLRIKKFVDRGFTISKETKKKIKQRTTRKSVKQYKKSRCSSGNRRCNS